jgi:galactokinase
MLLDCRDYGKTFIKLDHHELRVVIINSMVKHELSGGEYGQRRSQCEEGVAILKRQKPQIKALRDVTPVEVEEARSKLTDVVYRRCRHVVSENARTVEAAKALSEQRYERAGELMIQSHNSLRDDYEVSCAELDFLVEEAMKVKGVYGARMTGGGFGGCIVALVQPRSVETLIDKVHRAYTAKFNRQPNSFVTGAAAGASVIE